MKSDQQIHSKDVLRAIMDVRLRGNDRLMRQLEKREPDLTEFVLEELSTIHFKIQQTGIRARRLQQLSRRIEAMVHVIFLATRSAQARLQARDGGNDQQKGGS